MPLCVYFKLMLNTNLMKYYRFNYHVKLFPFRLLLTAGMVIALLNCTGKDNPDPQDPPPTVVTSKAKVFLTSGDKSKLFSKEGELTIKPTTSADFPVIAVDTSARFQEIDGYGAGFTGSSA